MAQSKILSPVLAMLCLAFVVWLWMFICRFRFIAAEKVDPQALSTPEQVYSTLPPYAANPGYNFRNLFEVPVLFYVLCIYLYMMGGVDSTHVTCAWAFFGFRVLPTLIQCRYNNVNHRFGAYALSCIALWVMLARTVLS